MANDTFSGDIKKMPQSILLQRIESGERELVDLRREMDRRNKFTSAERLADRLHYLLHSGQRPDSCDYDYSDWGGMITSCRADFLHHAQAIEANFPNNMNVVNLLLVRLEQARFGPNYVAGK